MSDPPNRRPGRPVKQHPTTGPAPQPPVGSRVLSRTPSDKLTHPYFAQTLHQSFSSVMNWTSFDAGRKESSSSTQRRRRASLYQFLADARCPPALASVANTRRSTACTAMVPVGLQLQWRSMGGSGPKGASAELVVYAGFIQDDWRVNRKLTSARKLACGSGSAHTSPSPAMRNCGAPRPTLTGTRTSSRLTREPWCMKASLPVHIGPCKTRLADEQPC